MGVNVFDQFTEGDCRSLLGCMQKVLLLENPNERDVARFLFKYTEELYNFSKGRNGKIGDLSQRFKDKWEINMKKRLAEKMAQPSKVKSSLTTSSTAPPTKKSNHFKATLDVLSKDLQKFIRKAPPGDALATKGPTEDPKDEKSSAMDSSSKRKEEKDKKGDAVRILTPYRPKDGYFHDPELSSQKGSLLSIPSDHSDRSYALSIFSLVSPARIDSQEGIESVLPNARKAERRQKKTNCE